MKEKKKLGYSEVLVIFSIVFLFPSCREKANADLLITATLKGPSSMAMIYMIDSLQEINGYQTKFFIMNEPQQVKALILSEKVDFAVVPSTMGALLYNKTGKYILAGIPVWGTLYLFGSDSTITSWNDLRGKKVSLMARGMTPDIMFRYLATMNGLEPGTDPELDYSFPGHIELANAIVAGIAEIGVISEPLVSLAMAKNPSIRPLIDFNSEWKKLFGSGVPFAQTALLVRKKLADNHPEIVMEYMLQLSESIFNVNTRPQEAARIIVKHDILPDADIAVQSIPRSNLHLSYAGEEREGINEYFKVFYNFNPMILGGDLPDEKFYFKKEPD